LRHIVRSFDLVASSRAHGIILPAVLGLPGICVGLEKKLNNVHKGLPSGTLLWDEPFRSRQLEELVETMLDNRRHYADRVSMEASINEDLAKKASEELAEWLTGLGLGKT
jgi:polysaccharide pyruvyl transferase WcaK-like protein